MTTRALAIAALTLATAAGSAHAQQPTPAIAGDWDGHAFFSEAHRRDTDDVGAARMPIAATITVEGQTVRGFWTRKKAGAETAGRIDGKLKTKKDGTTILDATVTMNGPNSEGRRCKGTARASGPVTATAIGLKAPRGMTSPDCAPVPWFAIELSRPTAGQ